MRESRQDWEWESRCEGGAPGQGVGTGSRDRESGQGVGTGSRDWESGLGGRDWESGLGVGTGSRDREGGTGSRDWEPGLGVGTGREESGGVPKKSVSRNSLRPPGGGPAESHREYYVGEGFLGKTPPPRRKKLTTHEGCDRIELLSPHGG